jgi:hypothetical protein
MSTHEITRDEEVNLLVWSSLHFFFFLLRFCIAKAWHGVEFGAFAPRCLAWLLGFCNSYVFDPISVSEKDLSLSHCMCYVHTVCSTT